jgi:TetR/AcrR family tetracycline transcriptional repressor
MAVDRDQVIRTALRLLNEVGLEGLTLRRLAQELGIQAPTLYWHIKSKQELLDEMATTMLRDQLVDTPQPSVGWPEWMRTAADGLRRMLLSYRDGAKVFSGTYLTDDSVLAAMEIPLRVLTDAGFSLPDAVHGWATIYSYVIGFTIEEQASASDARYRPERRARRIDADRYPLTQRAGAVLFGDADDRFRRGLDIILTGLGTATGAQHAG